jgi:BarA-like signal transduction histidine kinase
VGGLLKRIFFWNYERGTGPYDVIVLAIVAFVFLTPRTWFHDQAETSAAHVAMAIPCEAEDGAGKVLRCRVNAALLTPSQPSPQLQEKAHEVLKRNAELLKNRTFQIVRMEPVLGQDGGVLYYEVSVQK